MNTRDGRTGLEAMLEARSVAVVGASVRPESAGFQMLHQLVAGGFEGQIAPVNPRYDEIDGRPCYPSLAEVPFDVELAILGVPNSVIAGELEKAAALGIPAAVIFASGYEGDHTDSTLIDRLRKIAIDNEITVCGGNCMGFANFPHKLRALAFREEESLEPGPITWITHSGSAFTALLHNDRFLRFNLAISAGQELTTTMADYISYAVSRPETGVIALFLETVRDPAGFRDALGAAAEADVPVVALKVGKAEQARSLVTAHSGALAGQDAVFDAVFETYGVIRVGSMNEMADVLELFSSGRRATGGGLASVHDSGGERAHLIDVAEDVGVPFAAISEETQRRLAAVLEPGLPPVNPVDAWGTGNDFDEIFLECFRALDGDPEVGALAFTIDLAGEDPQWGYAPVAEQIFRETAKPFAVMSNLSSAIDREAAERLRRAGVPVLEDTVSGLSALGHLLARRAGLKPPPSVAADPALGERWRSDLGRGSQVGERDALRLLQEYGIPVVRSELVADGSSLLGAAESLGYPLALKVTGVEHKTEARGVVLGIENGSDLVRFYEELAPRSRGPVLLQQMAKRGRELALGMVRDAQFGPVVLLAAGGVMVEMLDDRRLALPPLDPERAMRLIDGLRLRPLLDGFRGAPPADVQALAEALVRFSYLAHDLGEVVEAIDVNPLIVNEEGAVAVDALIIPRAEVAGNDV